MIKLKLLSAALVSLILAVLAINTASWLISYRGSFFHSEPVIEFTPVTHSEEGIAQYYLFDDNPEHLNPYFLADGDVPSSIAHFENLTEGIYTVFSYHHRGDSTDFEDELYFDAVFSASDSSSFEILAIGIDKNWDWNQAWADYTETTVRMPLYMKTFNCTCSNTNGTCTNSNCPAIVRNEYRTPKTKLFTSINKIIHINNNSPIFLSDIESRIQTEDMNHFRYGGYDEPIWLMMKFRVLSGKITFDTLAYRHKITALNNFSILKKGPVNNEPQYKGISPNAPIVTAEFNYNISKSTPSGAIPVIVKNMRVPNGFLVENGTFATNVNTWKEEKPIAVESDLISMSYEDDNKLSLYGSNTVNRNNIWRFDMNHSKIYCSEYNDNDSKILIEYGIKLGDDFIPNIPVNKIAYPVCTESSSEDFYRLTACNLGNFGVTEKYIIHLKNTDSKTRVFSFEMKSIAGQVYRYKQTDKDGKILKDDGGEYYMKNFDADPAVDPNSQTEPKARITPPEYGDTLDFTISKFSECDIEIEITTLTGCTAPMHNTMYIQ